MDTLFKLVYFAGILVEIVVRLPYGRQHRQLPKTDQRISPAERGLLGLLFVGMFLIPLLFMGSLIAESFFGIPGLGSYTMDAINAQDFAIVRAMVFIGSVLYIIGLILADISYTIADPRVRFE